MRPSLELHKLLQLAEAYHFTEYSEAFGRCFAATLALADAARREGIAVELLRWQVQGDRDFCDHWALACSPGYVIDPTRIQVDGKTELLHSVASYPRHYGNMRRYAPELLLPLMHKLEITRRERMPARFIWRSGLALVCHDIRSAWRQGQWDKIALAIEETVAMTWRTAIGALQHHWVLEPPGRRPVASLETAPLGANPACPLPPTVGSG